MKHLKEGAIQYCNNENIVKVNFDSQCVKYFCVESKNKHKISDSLKILNLFII
jgi:hypothetical protein